MKPQLLRNPQGRSLVFVLLAFSAVESSAAEGSSAVSGGAPFGLINWLVLFAYLGVLVFIGWRCSRKEKNTENFFLGGRNIPWWAAGLSLFSTVLSAITFLAIPARAYATDWTLLPVNLCVLLVAPIIAFKYLPVLRRQNITTVYQYLESRFDRSIQLFGSASFILFQMGRMGIVLLLPALALSAVTGINVFVCIGLMGLLATLYTVLGGIEAVIWTDVLQTVVLLGGAIVALFIVGGHLDGGFGEMIEVGKAAGKFHWINLDTSLITDSIIVVILGGIFTNALVPYSSDQTVVQRYLTTKSENAARRSLWLGAIMVLPATLLFLTLGTALYVFYQQHPVELIELSSNDQILPWFIATQMPVGLAGLVIAGVFAASMSSLDSSMHSIATSLVTDWMKPLNRNRTDAEWLRIARRVTLAAGLFGTITAALLATMDIKYLWDFFLGLMGLLGGTLAGIMAVAVFLPRVKPCHLWPAIVAASAVLCWVKFFTETNGLLLGFLGIGTVFLVAVILSLAMPVSTGVRQSNE